MEGSLGSIFENRGGPVRAKVVEAAGPGLPVLTAAAEQPRGRQDPVSWMLMRKFRLAIKHRESIRFGCSLRMA